MGHLSPEKRALFSLLKKVGGHMPQLPPPPPGSAAPVGNSIFDDILMTYRCIMHCEHRAKVGYLRLVPLLSINGDDFVCSYLRFSAQ
jgi:hypothetical protein